MPDRKEKEEFSKWRNSKCKGPGVHGLPGPIWGKARSNKTFSNLFSSCSVSGSRLAYVFVSYSAVTNDHKSVA